MTLKPLVLEATRSHSNSATTFLIEIIPLLIESMAKKSRQNQIKIWVVTRNFLWLQLTLKYIVISLIFSHRLMTLFYLASIDFIQCKSCFIQSFVEIISLNCALVLKCFIPIIQKEPHFV
jgi:hypothetical protein